VPCRQRKSSDLGRPGSTKKFFNGRQRPGWSSGNNDGFVLKNSDPNKLKKSPQTFPGWGHTSGKHPGTGTGKKTSWPRTGTTGPRKGNKQGGRIILNGESPKRDAKIHVIPEEPPSTEETSRHRRTTKQRKIRIRKELNVI